MRTIGAVVVLLLGFAAPAHAGTLRVVESRTQGDHDEWLTSATVEYAGAPGERNVVTITADATAVRIADTGAPMVVASRDCTAAGLCPLPPGDVGLQVRVSGGDGDDVLDASRSTIGTALNGGAGDDVLIDGPTSDVLDPGPGRDTVTGGPGNDTVYAGDDGAHPAPDRIDGGPGNDTLDYSSRRSPLRIDLATGVAGEDRAGGFENVVGGLGHDVIAGDDGPNWLRGAPPDAPGGDVLEGRGGDDHLDGRAGADVLLGGAGDDVLSGWSGSDRYDAGRGRDIVELDATNAFDRVRVACDARDRVDLIGRAIPRLSPGCARTTVRGVSVVVRRGPGGRVRALALRWADDDYERMCHVDAELAVAGRVVARARTGRLHRAEARVARVRGRLPATGVATVRIGFAVCGDAPQRPRERFAVAL